MTTTTDPAPEEVLEGELVDPDPPGVALERATEPVPMPTAPAVEVALDKIPGHAELQTLAQLATTFAFSQLVPKPLQNRPEDVLLVLLTARDLGLSTTVALRECHPIDGRVTVSPKLKLAIVRERRLGRVWPDPDNDVTHHRWFAARADDPETVYSVTYTWRDAQRAGLVQEACTAGEHSDKCKKGRAWGASRADRDHSCKSNWVSYPGQMLQWRTMGYLMDQAFGEVGVGLYSADELGAVTDEDGHVIDILESGPIDGMPDRTPAKAEPGTDPNDVAPEDVRAQFKERIYRLPHPAIEVLREQWARRDERTGDPTLWPLPTLPNRQVKAAGALIAGFEKRAERAEWGPWTPDPLSWEAPQEAATEAPGGVDGDEATDGEGDQPDGDTGETSAPPYDPKNPPSDVLEAAIDRARAIPDDQLDGELEAIGQKVIASHKPDTKRKRLVQGWFVAGWTPDGWAPTLDLDAAPTDSE